MKIQELCFLPLVEVSEVIRRRDVSPVELIEAALDHIERVAGRLNCYITIAADEARHRAQELEELLRRGVYLGPLHGIPISLKDNIATAGLRTTAGSPILAKWVPPVDATVVNRLRLAGAVIIGKTSLFEFAYAAFHPRFGSTRNPWNLERSCSGSSSGSAASVAAGFCYGSIGTDTGGSIRVPAALCGIVGLRPTYGLVSKAGVVPLSYSLDTVGPMARTVHDVTVLLQTIAGPDRADPTVVSRSVPNYAAQLAGGVQGLRIGMAKRQTAEHIRADVWRGFEEACGVFEREGAALSEVALPDYPQARIIWRTLSAVEASEYHRPYLRTRSADYHPTDRALLEMAEFIPATDYVHAQRLRQRIVDEVRSIFARVDVLVVPAFPVPAYPVDASGIEIDGRKHDLADLTRSAPLFSLTGRPALVVPCGFASDGLPIGIQLVGRPFGEADLFRAAHAYERATDWHRMHPAI